VLVIALAARLLFTRLRERLPSWTLAVAAYAEVLWTFMLFTLVGQWWADVREWLGERAVTGWLQSIGDWFAAHIAPVAVLWEGALWTMGFCAGVLLVPAAWLTVAGVIYGTTFDSTPPSMRRGLAAVRGPVATTLARSLMQRFESLWAAVAVIWRGGPVLFGAIVLAYALWALAERLGTRGILQLFGGHDQDFWAAFLPLILVAVTAVAEPLRVAIVATAYDAVLERPEAGLDAGASGIDAEPGDLVLPGDVQAEGADGILRHEEDGKDVVGA
jgi:hypothetical protein